MISLRDYQMAGVTEIRKNLARGDKVICFQGPTGSGKTRMFTYITHNAAAKGNTTWIVVHRKELLRQASDSLTENGVAHGIISPQHTPDPFAVVQTASIDTLKNRYHKLGIPQIIICDEFHHSVSNNWKTIIDYYVSKGTRILGFTATPNRLDGKGLGVDHGGHCDSLIVGPQPKELIKRGFLAEPKLYVPTLASPEGLHSKFGEYKRDEVDAMMDKPTIIGDAVKQYSKICPNLPTIVFVPSLKMGAHVLDQYRASGYQAAIIEGKMTDAERKQRLHALGNGGLHILISCMLIDEGVDVPIVEGIQMLNPTKSLGKFLQQSGRGARMFPGKKGYFLLDHVCNTFYQNMMPNHGDPSWDRDWSLDGLKQGGKKKTEEKEIKVRQCNECYAVHTMAPACPFCGFVYQASAREIEQVEGELLELDIKRLEQIEQDKRRMFMRREEGMCRTFDDFKALAEKRGYDNPKGWAYFRTKARGVASR